METMWVEGQFRPVVQPVKVKGNSGTVDQTVLENYATKEDLKNATTTELDYNMNEETLEIK